MTKEQDRSAMTFGVGKTFLREGGIEILAIDYGSRTKDFTGNESPEEIQAYREQLLKDTE